MRLMTIFFTLLVAGCATQPLLPSQEPPEKPMFGFRLIYFGERLPGKEAEWPSFKLDPLDPGDPGASAEEGRMELSWGRSADPTTTAGRFELPDSRIPLGAGEDHNDLHYRPLTPGGVRVAVTRPRGAIFTFAPSNGHGVVTNGALVAPTFYQKVKIASPKRFTNREEAERTWGDGYWRWLPADPDTLLVEIRP